MTKAARNWRIAILLFVLLGVAGCPPQAEVDKACPLKGASDKKACRLLLNDESKRACSYKGQSDKKADCDKTEKKCDL